MNEGVDRLLCAVVHNDDANPVNDALVAAGFRTTRINAQGGFLRRGNAVFLIGIRQDALDQALQLVRGACTHRAADAPDGALYGVAFVIRASAFARI